MPNFLIVYIKLNVIELEQQIYLITIRFAFPLKLYVIFIIYTLEQVKLLFE